MAQASTTSQVSQATDPINLLMAWDKAFEHFRKRLRANELAKLDGTAKHQLTYHDLLEGVQKAKDMVEGKRYKFTGTVQNILKTISQYAIVGDAMVQHNPQTTALAWGAFRFILIAAVQEGETSEKLVNSLDCISRIIFRADEYTRLFAHQEISTKQTLQHLHDDLVQLFSEVLFFLFQAKAFFEKRSFRRYISTAFKPFEKEFQGTYGRITRLEAEVGKDIGLLNAELDTLRQGVENGLWLKHAEFSSDLEKLNKEYLGGTCGWFLKNHKVENWMDPRCSTTGLLWVHGKPGCGKSTLASQLINHLSASTLPVLRVFCKNGTEDKSDIVAVLRNILFQLVENSGPKRKQLHSIVQAERMRAATPFANSLQQLWPVLERILQSIDGFYCVIDALDECTNSNQEIADFVHQLTKIPNSSPNATAMRCIVFSRHQLPDLGDNSRLWECHHVVEEDVEDDIVHYASVKLNESSKLSKHKAKDRLLNSLIQGSEGMILWTRLMFSELKSGHWNVDAVLQRPPKGLDSVYTGIFQRLVEESQDPAKYREVFRLVLAAAYPLHFTEFDLAMAMLSGLSDHEDYNCRSNPRADVLAIISEVSPLLIIMPDDTVQLVHKSLRDFLLRDEPAKNGFFFKPSELHGPVTIALLSYISLPCFVDELPAQWHYKYPLLWYATNQLIWHLIQVEERATECALRLADFIHTTQGWRWFERFQEIFCYSHGSFSFDAGRLQVLQANVNDWTDNLPPTDISNRSVLRNIFVDLARRRFEETVPGSTQNCQAMKDLAIMYSNHGRLVEAEELEVKLLATYTIAFGHDYLEKLRVMGNLAVSYGKQGRWGEAEELELSALAGFTKIFGPDHLDTVGAMRGLALAYASQGRWDEAEDLGLKVLATCTKLLGHDHPDTLGGMRNLAIIYASQGRWDEAKELHSKVLDACTKVLGHDHPDTLATMQNLAVNYKQQGRCDEAEELELKVLAAYTKLLGHNHPNTLVVMRNLVITYSQKDRYNDAEELLSKALSASTEVFGHDHPNTLNTMASLANTYMGQGRAVEAIELITRVVDRRCQIIGDNHPDTNNSRKVLQWMIERNQELEGSSREIIGLDMEAGGMDGGDQEPADTNEDGFESDAPGEDGVIESAPNPAT